MSINTHNTHIIHGFQYHAPSSVAEAVKLLDDYGFEATILAGGTDLLPKMKQALIKPLHVVNLKRIPELAGVTRRSNTD